MGGSAGLQISGSRESGILEFWGSQFSGTRRFLISVLGGIWDLAISWNLGFAGFRDSGISGISGILGTCGIWDFRDFRDFPQLVPAGGGRGAFNKCIFLRFFGTPNVEKGSHFDNRVLLGDIGGCAPSKWGGSCFDPK